MRFMGRFQITVDESNLGSGPLRIERYSDNGRPTFMITQDGKNLGIVPDSFKGKIFFDEPYILQVMKRYESHEGCVLEINYMIAKEYTPIYKKKQFWLVLLALGAAAILLSRLMVMMNVR
jgi:hypothetical protein